MGDSQLAEVLRGRAACPDCVEVLASDRGGFRCSRCLRTFEVREGIPVLLPKGFVPVERTPRRRTSSGYQQNYQQLDRAERYNDKYRKQLLKRASTGREFRLIARLLEPLGRSEVVLDLPSGGGRLSPALAPFTAAIIEADIAFGQLLHGRSTSTLDTPQSWLHASAFNIPLADQSVDGTLCVRLAHHLPEAGERERLVREVLRVSKRFALLTFFDFHSTKNRLRRLRQPFEGKPPKITMTRQEIRALAEEQGFSLQACPPLSRLFSGHRYALMVRS